MNKKIIKFSVNNKVGKIFKNAMVFSSYSKSMMPNNTVFVKYIDQCTVSICFKFLYVEYLVQAVPVF